MIGGDGLKGKGGTNFKRGFGEEKAKEDIKVGSESLG